MLKKLLAFSIRESFKQIVLIKVHNEIFNLQFVPTVISIRFSLEYFFEIHGHNFLDNLILFKADTINE